ncbi:T9SS type A sorting domain-containing protein [Psychroserpens burtonensis]|uniref:T9SS type A sorting domain-containing protein n=1 Tax=Psychroserpens burtonensis TaxID=49278 RepID=A0A5C7BBI9_9FLAO|nr:T9SS type A sorting domain-containing protein [Psychroserpens burtonensis]TXE19400.1 T9SS type A sorting domain-containing protein [Psychroserpens burtonensis]
MKKLYFLLLTILMSSTSFAQVLTENFDYGMTAGDLTTISGGAWVQHSGSSGPVAYVAAPSSLTMTGYPSSGVGGHATYSGTSQDVNRAFPEISSGTVYGSALVNLSAVGNGNYFMHFNSGGFRARVGAQDNGNGDILFGIGSSSSTLTYGTTPYSLNTTYLLVFSYEIATGVSNLHVLSAVTPTEPAAPEATNTGGTGTTISAIAFRQSSNIPALAIDGVRIATNWNEIMNNSTAASVSIVTPADATVYAPGTSSVDVTFTTQNIDLMIAGNQVNITVGASPMDADVSSPYAVPTVDGGSYMVTVELLESNTVIDTKMVSFSVNSETQVATIADLRAGTVGQVYELTGEAIITYIVTDNNRNQKYIQDATGGILIDDQSGTLTPTLNIGDGLTGLQGQLGEFSGVLQFVPVADLPGASSTGTTITPEAVTVSQFLAASESYESELIQITGVTFAVTGAFTDNTNYNITAGGDVTIARVTFGNENLIGANIPTTMSSVIGLGSEFNGTYQVLPRYVADVAGATLSLDNIQNNTFSVYPNPTSTGFVNVAGTNDDTISVSVYDLLGKQVINETLTSNRINVSALNAGIYMVKISQNDASITKKLVIK